MGHKADIATVWQNAATTWDDFRSGRADIRHNIMNAMKHLQESTPIVHADPMLPLAISNRI